MAKKSRRRAVRREPTIEERLAALGPCPRGTSPEAKERRVKWLETRMRLEAELRRRRMRTEGPQTHRVNGLDLAVNSDDVGPPERFTRDELIDVDVYERKELRRVKKVITQTPLDRYRAHQELDPGDPRNNERLWVAGNTLRETHFFAGLSQRVIGRYDEASGRSIDAPSAERREQARRAYQAAIDAIGPELARVVVYVVCEDGSATGWAEQEDSGYYRPRDGMVALRLGLEALARYYKMPHPKYGLTGEKKKGRGRRDPVKAAPADRQSVGGGV